ncbi:LOW QUALITY PROTEIN: hypothetical protein SORBI_3002G380150 [Sorghum bicolor]|uniref:Uncharacterized protein n=1 Tax=Sorghum bicolor TaxID=4558 RepID=A0A1W0W7B1_SORBI|nr:LOW QUALITY PROTEIN: hypothetical protein SORBI_3002G380150 [Sorghum bicolor]
MSHPLNPANLCTLHLLKHCHCGAQVPSLCKPVEHTVTGPHARAAPERPHFVEHLEGAIEFACVGKCAKQQVRKERRSRGARGEEGCQDRAGVGGAAGAGEDVEQLGVREEGGAGRGEAEEVQRGVGVEADPAQRRVEDAGVRGPEEERRRAAAEKRWRRRRRVRRPRSVASVAASAEVSAEEWMPRRRKENDRRRQRIWGHEWGWSVPELGQDFRWSISAAERTGSCSPPLDIASATPPLAAGARAGGMTPPAPRVLVLVLETSTAPDWDVLDLRATRHPCRLPRPCRTAALNSAPLRVRALNG